MDYSKRKSLLAMVGLVLSAPLRYTFAEEYLISTGNDIDGNFRHIYKNDEYKKDFRQFLINVFNLFPEEEFHQLIGTNAIKLTSDHDIYLQVQKELTEIQPFLSALRYSLPALSKQKSMIAEQTSQLLSKKREIKGYLEIGSTGRYIDSLEEVLNITGKRYFIADKEPNNSFTDIVDRGQLRKAGEFIHLNNYQPKKFESIEKSSLDLVTVYIGFHHCPIPLRNSFFKSIYRVLTPGGVLVVRDHNAHNQKMQSMVALAHDVFNLGTRETWDYNRKELRHFYSLDALDKMLLANGFRSDGTKLYQKGDPTLNALMLYEKI